MYFPYLRGKQFELIALREYFQQNHKNNKVIPIIEPVKENLAQLTKTLNLFEKKDQDVFLIINPQIGSLETDINSTNKSIEELLNKYKKIAPAFIVNNRTEKNAIETILDDSENILLIHNDSILDSSIYPFLKNNQKIRCNLFKIDSRSYRRKVSLIKKSIMLEDCFPSEKRNEDYPDDNFFSDEIFYYKNDGLCGFSDFSIIGDDYREEGGPAYSVTIHLVYEKTNEELRIRHFKSDEKGSPTNPGGKFLEALIKLINWIDYNPSFTYESNGIKELRKLYKDKHYPGLGYLKKISLIHHLELCNLILNR